MSELESCPTCGALPCDWAAGGVGTIPGGADAGSSHEQAVGNGNGTSQNTSPPQPGEVERRRSALEFYANNYSWRSSTVYMCGHSGASSAELDRGNKARAALTPSESGEAIRPKAGGVEAQGDDKKFGDGTPDGFFITFADGSTSFEFTEEDRDEALADALPGAKWDAVYKLAAAPEPLRVAGEEVERIKRRVERLETASSGETGTGLSILCRQAAADLRSVLALIEPSAGKDFGADLSKPQPAESGEGTQPSPTGWRPIETAPKDRGPIVVAFSPEDWTTAEAVWRDGEWRAACWFAHRASNHFESREHVVKPVYWQPRPVRSTPDQTKPEVKDV